MHSLLLCITKVTTSNCISKFLGKLYIWDLPNDFSDSFWTCYELCKYELFTFNVS